MRLTMPRTALFNALTLVNVAVPSRRSVPILSGTLVTATSGGVTFRATDWDTYATADVDADVSLPGTVAVSARALTDWEKTLPKSVHTVALTLVDGCTLRVAGADERGTGYREIPTMPAEDFPADVETVSGLGTVPLVDLVAAVKATAPAASTDSSLPNMCTVSLQAENRTIRVDATDRYRLASVDLTWSPAGPSNDWGALVDARTMVAVTRAMSKIAGRKLTGDVTVGSRYAGLENAFYGMSYAGSDGAYYVLKIRSRDVDNYPRVRGLFPGNAVTTVTVDGAALVDLVKRVADMRGLTPVVLTFDGRTVTAEFGESERTPGEPAARDTGDLVDVVDGPAVTVGLRPAYVADAIGAVGTGHVTVSLVDGFKPVVIAPVDGGKANRTLPTGAVRHLVMPIRTTGRVVKPAATAPVAAVDQVAPVTEPHAYVSFGGSSARRCGLEGCDRGKTAAIHRVPTVETAVAAPVPAVDQVATGETVTAVTDAVTAPDTIDQVGPRVHVFASAGEAYDRTQAGDTVSAGDILHVPSEKLVGFVFERWPVAVTVSAGTDTRECANTDANGNVFRAAPNLVEIWNRGYQQAIATAVTMAETLGYGVAGAPTVGQCDAVTSAPTVETAVAAPVPAVDQVATDETVTAVTDDVTAPDPVDQVGPRVRAIIADGSWSIVNVGNRRNPHFVPFMKLPSSTGRLDRDTYTAVRDTLRAVADGAWSRKLGGFTFRPGVAGNPWRAAVPSGADLVSRWLAETAPIGDQGDTGTPVVDATPDVPAVGADVPAETVPAVNGDQVAPVVDQVDDDMPAFPMPADFVPYAAEIRGCRCPFCRKVTGAVSAGEPVNGPARVLLAALRTGHHRRFGGGMAVDQVATVPAIVPAIVPATVPAPRALVDARSLDLVAGIVPDTMPAPILPAGMVDAMPVIVTPADFNPYRDEIRDCACTVCVEISYNSHHYSDDRKRRHAARVLLAHLVAGTHQRVTLAEVAAFARTAKAARLDAARAAGAPAAEIAVIERGYATVKMSDFYATGMGLGIGPRAVVDQDTAPVAAVDTVTPVPGDGARTVHVFGFTGDAYEAVNSGETVKSGDLLHIPDECVVGVATSSRPMAVTAERGELHAAGPRTVAEWMAEGYGPAIDEARALAVSLGYALADDTAPVPAAETAVTAPVPAVDQVGTVPAATAPIVDQVPTVPAVEAPAPREVPVRITYAVPAAVPAVEAPAPAVEGVVPVVPETGASGDQGGTYGAHAQRVHVSGIGEGDGYRFHLVAGANGRALAKDVKPVLARMRREVGAAFYVTAPRKSGAINVVPQPGHTVTDWAPVLALFADMIGDSIAPAAECGACDRSAALVES